MKRILLLCTAVIALFPQGCRDNIDELIRNGDFEAGYYYHSGGLPADRFVIITVVINKNGGALKREERSASDTKKNRETLTLFRVSNADLKKLYSTLEQQGFYALKTVQIENPGARTLYLKIKAGSTQYIQEESPVLSMASNFDRRKFMSIISKFNVFVKERLPAGQKPLVDF